MDNAPSIPRKSPEQSEELLSLIGSAEEVKFNVDEVNKFESLPSEQTLDFQDPPNKQTDTQEIY